MAKSIPQTKRSIVSVHVSFTDGPNSLPQTITVNKDGILYPSLVSSNGDIRNSFEEITCIVRDAIITLHTIS